MNDRRVDADGTRERFTSRILPPYMRRSPQVSEVLPLLYLRGLSTGDFREALSALLGEDASGLSPTTISRLMAAWDEEYEAFRHRDLSGCDYVYVWVDGIHFNIRLEEDRLCTLVVIGMKADGTKELVALEDGYRESEESWGSVLRNLRHRGLRAPACTPCRRPARSSLSAQSPTHGTSVGILGRSTRRPVFVVIRPSCSRLRIPRPGIRSRSAA